MDNLCSAGARGKIFRTARKMGKKGEDVTGKGCITNDQNVSVVNDRECGEAWVSYHDRLLSLEWSRKA